MLTLILTAVSVASFFAGVGIAELASRLLSRAGLAKRAARFLTGALGLVVLVGAVVSGQPWLIPTALDDDE